VAGCAVSCAVNGSAASAPMLIDEVGGSALLCTAADDPAVADEKTRTQLAATLRKCDDLVDRQAQVAHKMLEDRAGFQNWTPSKDAAYQRGLRGSALPNSLLI